MQTDAVNVDSDLPNEYLYGRAGYLFALLYINKNISPHPIPDKNIRNVCIVVKFMLFFLTHSYI